MRVFANSFAIWTSSPTEVPCVTHTVCESRSGMSLISSFVAAMRIRSPLNRYGSERSTAEELAGVGMIDANETSAAGLGKPASAFTAVERSTATHSMTESSFGSGPKMAFASSRPRSASNPLYVPFGSRNANGGAFSSTAMRILPFVCRAYMYEASSKRGRAAVGLAVGVGELVPCWGRHETRAMPTRASATNLISRAYARPSGR